ncbi:MULTISPECIES: ABC transporter substrate-binding protein [Bacillus]|uniref:ABC transporter substrate-binding protein n=1 Tax=Bacillus TaxID=1386 RepID=UPI0002FD5E2B|nr:MULTISPECIES: extracellular solute-binding protein [Bacillus]
MNNKRLITILSSFVLLLTVFLAGCSNEKVDSKNEKSNGKEKVEITAWLTPQWKGVLDGSEEGADYDSFLKYAAKKFSEQYEDYDVKVNIEVIAGDQRDELLNVNLNGGTPPNIFFESVFAMGDYVHRGALEPITDIVDDQAKEDIPKSIWENVTFGKDIYFYPFSQNPGTFAYNADMLRAAGLESYIGEENEIKTWTLKEFETILNALKTKLPKDQFPNAYPMGLYALNNQADTWNLAYLRMFGNEFFNSNNEIVVAKDSGIKAAKWMEKIYKSGLTNPGPESVSSNDTNAMFQNQQLAINFTNAILYTNAKNDMKNGDLPKFDVRLANIPSESGDPLTFTYVTGAAVFKSEDKIKTKVSKDFVKFFSTDEELVKSSKNGVPVRSSVAEEFANEQPLFKAYDENSKYLFTFTGNVAGYNELRQVLYPELQAIYTGEKKPEKAIKDYQKKGNEIIKNAKADSVIGD